MIPFRHDPTQVRKLVKAILIHGNGGSTPNDNWFPYLKTELEKIGIETKALQFPDAVLARTSYWLPFLQSLKPDENTIIIGHSSGAIAAMRYAEKHPLLGSVLVGSYHTDLGIETEKISGYFDLPWNWEAIKNNQQWIIQFASTNDPWIPVEEARYVRDHLNTDYHESSYEGHYGGDHYKPTFPEALEAIKSKLKPG
jgi:predicted alpha/beta hydrolase family esterase